MDGHFEMAHSAEILQFPVGGRAALARRAMFRTVQNENRPAPKIMYDSWYHEDAISDGPGKVS